MPWIAEVDAHVSHCLVFSGEKFEHYQSPQILLEAKKKSGHGVSQRFLRSILLLSGYSMHKWGCSADSAAQEMMPGQLQATLKELQRRPLESQVFSLADL